MLDEEDRQKKSLLETKDDLDEYYKKKKLIQILL